MVKGATDGRPFFLFNPFGDPLLTAQKWAKSISPSRSMEFVFRSENLKEI